MSITSHSAPSTTPCSRARASNARLAASTTRGSVSSNVTQPSLTRAIQKLDGTLRAPLKKEGLLTRDGRMRERKKPGRPGARKRFQFSKR